MDGSSNINGKCLKIISGVKVPIAILGAQIDKYSPLELLKQFEEVLTAKSEVGTIHYYMFLFSVLPFTLIYIILILNLQVDSYVKVFPNTEHGWTVRYNVEDEAAMKSAEEAHQILLEWCVKYVIKE